MKRRHGLPVLVDRRFEDRALPDVHTGRVAEALGHGHVGNHALRDRAICIHHDAQMQIGLFAVAKRPIRILVDQDALDQRQVREARADGPFRMPIEIDTPHERPSNQTSDES